MGDPSGQREHSAADLATGVLSKPARLLGRQGRNAAVDFQRLWIRINKPPVSLTAWTLPAVHFLALFFFLDGDDRLGSRLKSALWYRIAAQIREAVGAFPNLLECPLDVT